MGLTKAACHKNAVDACLDITKKEDEKIIALAGNPNVGKSTVFNALTGMNQHTGNWTGKTVANAVGRCKFGDDKYLFVDIPGTYSLMAHSPEEKIARDFICFAMPDITVVMCDATCLERNLNLVLQTLEITDNVVVCVNLLDQAKRKNISVDIDALSDALGVKCVGVVATQKKSINALLKALENSDKNSPYRVNYPPEIENAISKILPYIDVEGINKRYVALRLIDADSSLISSINDFVGRDILENEKLRQTLSDVKKQLGENFEDVVVQTLVEQSEKIAKSVIKQTGSSYNSFDYRIDRILTSKLLGFPVMLALLLFTFWLTIKGANYPSALLSELFLKFQMAASKFILWLGTPSWLHDMLVFGVLRVLCWVVSVMLPPMAIFFPMFTLLEDLGYLPRIAYNLDKPFKKCSSCGKQALTMCMGFGCNAAGVTGCRIIDSERERLIAILTNSFVPCNGRFPILITLISMFVVWQGSAFKSAVILTLVIILSVMMTFVMSSFLSKTFLRGKPSSFALELPAYRKPKIVQTVVRSLFDRTLFVVARAACVAAPAGLVIWLMANITIDSVSILNHVSQFIDPFARLLGMDGVIILAFILGFPANEIVLPIIVMTYLANGMLINIEDVSVIRTIFVQNGWTATTAVCTMLFSPFHFPCSTTVITVYKETKSIKWTVLSIVLPTLVGMILCALVNLLL